MSLSNCLTDLESYKNGTQKFPTHLENFEADVTTIDGDSGKIQFKDHHLEKSKTNLTSLKSTFVNKLIANISARLV